MIGAGSRHQMSPGTRPRPRRYAPAAALLARRGDHGPPEEVPLRRPAAHRRRRRRPGPRRPARPRTSATRTALLPRPLRRPARPGARPDGRRRRHHHAAGRHARVRQRLQAPGRAGQGVRHARRPVGRSARARHRRRLDEERLRPVGHPDGPAEGAGRPDGGGHRGPQGRLRRRPARLRRRALHDHRVRRPAEAGAEAAPAVPHRRRAEAGAVDRRPGGRHRRHQPVDPQRRGRRRRGPHRAAPSGPTRSSPG